MTPAQRTSVYVAVRKYSQTQCILTFCAAAVYRYEKWKNYVGLNEANRCVESDRPGPLTMVNSENTATDDVTDATKTTTTTESADDDAGNSNNSSSNTNTFVDEKIWKKWLKWYGIADSHDLDRRNWASDDKVFEVCILNPYSAIVQNPVKTFDVSEQTGYIELQLRKIFRVPKHRQTRLWGCEKARNARFHLLLQRAREICFQEYVDTKREYILALEIANLDGTWPTQVPGATVGSLERYESVTEAPRSAEYWETELATAVETVNCLVHVQG